ncbi:alpha-N-acetylgalactosaminide alpha-2,6-sialyltransferase 1-like isoform X2 [Kryptolebias marmoratus]|uniref:alpha-N-acetylgalactosaminide alpha-2,6-sialyltransferase 1-like isoform X2 n=1 Tax=Kryptolebias marmoratus TaxID=37003 RepID=UPI0007F8B7A6|nr:alpha-N-acetylgalactosaminide alpha-2,6-sialyltransferase 1-like isoform X2 [Kryptolebias marmoratus]XP_017294089.1 alpha-N-acetylgalactosaminide alpha-2,6-sialyltransferase 1-like isoform X2 [Kryptolebias marmoratus]
MHSRTGFLEYNRFREDSDEGESTPSPENPQNYRTTRRNSLMKPKSDKKTTPAETPIPVLSLKSFDKLPQWDFEDIYNQDSPPRLTTCAQSLRNSQDEDFQKAFLPGVRLYLHRDNINMSEWNRLSHFNNPFGFMEMKYDDVIPAVKLIPEPKEPLLLPKPGGDGCVHCAVVGTGGILNGSKMGAEIDAHDYVFRMNGAAIEGYEEDVGKRTSVYVHTAHSITASLLFFKEYGYKSAPHDEGIKYVLIPEGLRDFKWLWALLKGQMVSFGRFKNKDPRSYYSGQFNESRFYVLHQDFLRYVRNRFLKSRGLNESSWAIVRPTNGAFTIFLALHVCDTVSAYGFMTEDYIKYSNYYVEKSRKTDVIFYTNHDLILEKDLWKSLHDRKIMKLFQRTESLKETEAEEPLTLRKP